MAPDRHDDAQLSYQLAREAGQLLLQMRDSFGAVNPEDRARLRELRNSADAGAHDLLAARLAKARPQDAVLSEEGVDDAARLPAPRVWIVDPLDGTFEYGQGRPDFAVHVALWEASAAADRASGGLVAATIDLPAQGGTWSTLDPAPTPAPVPGDRPVRIVVSRTRRPDGIDEVVARLAEVLAREGLTDRGVELVPVGSVGAKVAELLAGRAEVYLHDTGFHEWDLAAPLAVARHYGFWCDAPGGGGFAFNRMPTLVPGVVMAVPSVSQALREVLGH